MAKYLRIVIFFYLCILTSIAFAQFPYIESFRNATAPGINFGGAPSAFLTAGGSAYDLGTLTHIGTPIDPVGNGYLRLTNRLTNQKGYIYSNSVFPSTKGLTVQFEYYIYGGTGADGISFFLYDATADPFTIGGFGGSLGYAQITTTTPASAGVSKGYLGIGLDEFGNFSNPTEGRQGGIWGQSPGSVTLRGKGDGAALTVGNYQYLTSVRTSTKGFSMVGDQLARQPDSTSNGYRRVLMDMVPNPLGGYNITVRITRGGTPRLTSTIIDNFHYAEAAPANLKYGIASSTGNQTNFHEIRNVFIDVLDDENLLPAIAVNDNFTACQGIVSTMNVIANDSTPNEGGSINIASIDLDANTIGLQNTYAIAGKGVFSMNQDGNVIFTPEPGFTGAAVATYNVKDDYGKTSNNATITVTYSPAPQQVNAGTNQLLNISTATTTYTLQGNNPGINTGLWTQISGPTATIANPTQFNSPINNMSSGEYVFRWTVRSAGGCEVFDEVSIIVNRPPIANNDALSTDINTSGTVLILANDTDPDGNQTIDKTAVVIVRLPQNGTLSINPENGIVIYTPNNGFSGNDDFVYTVKDNYGAVSNEATVTIIVNPAPIPSTVGLAKALTTKTKNIDGSYDLTYIFTLVNYGDLNAIYNISLTDDLGITFKGNDVTVKRLTATGLLNVNTAYDGVLNKNLLLPTSALNALSKEQVVLELNVKLNKTQGTFNNTAIAQGLTLPDGNSTSDQSTDGLIPDPNDPKDVSPSTPTPVNLTTQELFIPGGFSPNNDGINDYFIIENGSNLQIQLEIFNRWGNLVFKDRDYKNNWNGKTSEGIHVGDDLPVGIYYYVIIIDGKEKKAGPLAIRR
jgi:gliding motility-associated-like protein